MDDNNHPAEHTHLPAILASSHDPPNSTRAHSRRYVSSIPSALRRARRSVAFPLLAAPSSRLTYELTPLAPRFPTAYGHARPLLYLALNLLTMHPHLSITYLGAKQLASKLVAQLDRYGANEDVKARFHLVFFGEVEDGEGAQLIRVPDLGNFV